MKVFSLSDLCILHQIKKLHLHVTLLNLSLHLILLFDDHGRVNLAH